MGMVLAQGQLKCIPHAMAPPVVPPKHSQCQVPSTLDSLSPIEVDPANGDRVDKAGVTRE